MQIGRLDKIITLSELVETNTGGALSQSYNVVATVYGYVFSPRGNETFESATLNASQTIRILIRYRDDLNIKWRIGYNGQDYHIIDIDRTMKRKGELWLTCQIVSQL